LPLEVVQSIFAWLPPKQVHRMKALSRRMNEYLSTAGFARLNLSKVWFAALSDDAVIGFNSSGISEFEWFFWSQTYQKVYADMKLKNVEVVRYWFKTLACIPSAIGILKNLKVLALIQCSLSGHIPNAIGSLSNIQKLNLGINNLEGPIPIELYTLPLLQELDLFSNQLEGVIPAEVGNWKSLRNLNLGSNNFHGSLPPELGNCTMLQSLTLCSNQFEGPIPSQLDLLTNLSKLNLEDNNFSGPLPDNVFQNMPGLTFILLSNNYLNGPLPNSIPASIIVLSFHHCCFEGEIPASWSFLESLFELHVENNFLTGAIPEWCFDRLSRFYYHDNQFTLVDSEESGVASE
ncbi:hypothetical protein HDU99_002173, partial [Rhizoclosmatium hyalinum]